ncbi:hypothetical protein CYMTET_25861 [Cymbomonas tetramitiformis]|uniref:Uncharacterized protein n=1 Tax=Cymbomonas tetramitiformis TaxID=36881 RepID=A0AAE0FT04_9CHLO|nr:hypothetical protein CYMTET_25861 [Cymbomonas tetramitiformis]
MDNTPKPKVTGKTAVITGGSQGSGRETAFLFARKGYNVVICAREPARLQSVADEIVKAIPTASVLAIPTDITQRDSVDDFIDIISDTYESVSVLVNNAGVCLSGSFADTTLEDWDSQVAVNLMGAVMVTQGLLEPLTESKTIHHSLDASAGARTIHPLLLMPVLEPGPSTSL